MKIQKKFKIQRIHKKINNIKKNLKKIKNGQ